MFPTGRFFKNPASGKRFWHDMFVRQPKAFAAVDAAIEGAKDPLSRYEQFLVRH